VDGERVTTAAAGGYGTGLAPGNAGDNLIDSHQGDDRIWGNDGYDTLRGNAGEDVFSGGNGNDRLGRDEHLTVAEMLDLGEIRNGNAVFDIGGGDVPTVLQINHLDLLANDLIII
jgi:Ca2+-binding RTX toxin-like protein